MHSYTKSQLAYFAGVSPDTFRRWLNSDPDYLRLCRRYHLKRSAKLLPPPVVSYLSNKYCIDLP